MNEKDRALVSIAKLRKTYGQPGRVAPALDGISLDIADGEFFTLLGPSGSGKSTLLRALAGLEHPDEGTISIAGRVVSDPDKRVNEPPNLRHIGMVFQSLAIWPHLTVFENIAFPLRYLPAANRPGAEALRLQVQMAMDSVSLSAFSDRRAQDLSGGQKQRVALARSLVAEPRLVLLDEPLSNLDAQLRGRLGEELRSVQARTGLAFVFVTHDQSEALSLSHRICVMNEGRIEQIGTPEEIYNAPANRFVAEFVGSGVYFDSGAEAARLGLDVPGQYLDCPIIIRPEDLQIVPDRGVAGRIVSRTFHGDHMIVTVAVGERQLSVRSAAEDLVGAGATLRFGLVPGRCRPVGSKR